MIPNVRWVLAVCIGVILLIAGGAGIYFREQAAATLYEMAERENMTAARHFSAGIWHRHREASKGAATSAFREDVAGFLQSMQMAGLRVYDAGGQLLYSTGGTLSASDFTGKAQAVRQSPGHVISMLTDAAGSGLYVQGGPEHLRYSFVMLGQQDGYLELFSDISAPWKRVQSLQWLVTAGILLLCGAMLAALLAGSRKMEGIVAKQHERIIELEAAAASAQEANQQKTQFLANISHELRTPLNAIIGFSDIMKSEMVGEIKNPQLQGYVSDIHSSGVHLLSLINDILDFSKAEAGKLELEIEEINAVKLATSCLRLVSPRAEAANVELVNALPKEHFVLETDGKKFKQVLLNLLSNAVKFTRQGGKVTLMGWHDLTTDSYIFQVTDTGIGISPKDIAKAMAPFGQVDNTLSRRYEGTGLGLPLTKKFVELMGGKFSIQSEINVGTTVTFSIPRVFRASLGVVYKHVA